MKTTRTLDALDLSMARSIAFRLCGSRDSDVESAAMAGLLKAAQTWHADRGAWVTWAVRRIRWDVTNELLRRRDDLVDVSVLPDSAMVVGIVTSGEAVERLREALALLDADELLDGVDMRKTKHRALVAQLRAALS